MCFVVIEVNADDKFAVYLPNTVLVFRSNKAARFIDRLFDPPLYPLVWVCHYDVIIELFDCKRQLELTQILFISVKTCTGYWYSYIHTWLVCVILIFEI